MYGPKDGAPVPEMLWALDEIELQESSKNGTMLHVYVLNYENKSYYYKGVINPKEEQ
jgi:hypothetical protein